jgi:hypothetical protein
MSQTPERSFSEKVFAYPETPHIRMHGPRGYVDDEHYKPWLRDEFTFCPPLGVGCGSGIR